MSGDEYSYRYVYGSSTGNGWGYLNTTNVGQTVNVFISPQTPSIMSDESLADDEQWLRGRVKEICELIDTK